MKYNPKEPIINIGMYFKPLLMVPFSTIETISDVKNEIIAKAATENSLNPSGFTAVAEKEMGKPCTFCVVLARLDTKLKITIKRWKDKENNKGAITITIAPKKIV